MEPHDKVRNDCAEEGIAVMCSAGTAQNSTGKLLFCAGVCALAGLSKERAFEKVLGRNAMLIDIARGQQ